MQQILRGGFNDMPLLGEGEMALCLDTRQLFIGNGQENILIADPEEMEQLMASNAQLKVANAKLSAALVELTSKFNDLSQNGGSSGGGSIAGPIDATTLRGHTIDEFLFTGDESVIIGED